MVRLLLLLLFLSFSSNVWAINYCQDVSVKGCWTFDETSGNLIDQSSNGNDLTVGANITQNQSGQFGTSYNFDGTNGNAGCAYKDGTSSFQQNRTFSVIAYVKVASAINGGIISRGSNATYYRLATGKGNLVDSNAEDVLAGNTAVTNNIWQNTAMTIDGSGNIIIYLNGTSDNTGSTASNLNNGNNQGWFDIGQDSSSGLSCGGEGFVGNLDEIAYFAKVLSSTEINDILTNGLISVTATGTIPDQSVMF